MTPEHVELRNATAHDVAPATADVVANTVSGIVDAADTTELPDAD